MKYYDITQELFSSRVYPGDPAPESERIQEISRGDDCNLTYLKMCVHNGTHMDAPRHFLEEGRSMEEILPQQFMGRCLMCEAKGEISADEAARMAADAGSKLLLKGNAVITEAAASVFAEAGLTFLGVESQTVGAEDNTQKVHKILLASDMVIVEGLVLENVEPGTYFLCALPLKLAGSDGAPCRTVLVDFET